MPDFGKMARDAQKAMDSDRGEKTTDGLLDKAASAASKITGGKHDDAIAKGRDKADEHLGKRDRGDG